MYRAGSLRAVAEEVSKYVRFSGSTGGQVGWRLHRTSKRIYIFYGKGNENHEIGKGFLNIRGSCRYYKVLTTVYNTQRYWVFGLCPSSGFEITENTTFRKLDLFPSSGDGRHLLCWVP
jgi:hypothetical protein